MLQGKVISMRGEYSVELANGESFKVSEKDLSDVLKKGNIEVDILLSPIGESASQPQAIELLNHLLQIN